MKTKHWFILWLHVAVSMCVVHYMPDEIFWLCLIVALVMLAAFEWIK